MVNDPSQINEIVRLVVDRLRSQEPVERGLLELDQKIIAIRDVEGRLDGVTCVRLSNSSLITPAAKDELRSRGIQIERGMIGIQRNEATLPGNPIEKSFDIQIVAPQELQAGLQSIVKSTSVHVQTSSESVHETAMRLSSELTAAAGAMKELRSIWWTLRPFAAIIECLRTNNAAMRAISLVSTSDLSRAVEEAQPNLMVLDANHWPAYQLIRLVRAWSKL